MSGRRTEDSVALIAPHLCAKSEAATLEDLEGTSLEGMVALDGAREFLATLDPARWAVVTSSSLLSAVPKLSACGLPMPRVLITSGSVTEGKPHPEPFLRAALALGFQPHECLVFEDSDIGVRSALAAGCNVVVVGAACDWNDAGIVGRITSFVEMTATADGEVLIRGEPISAEQEKNRG